MRCDDALLTHLQGDEAPADRQREADAHIARCPDCAGVVDDLGQGDGRTPGLHHRTGRGAVERLVRAVLGIVSGAQLLVALPWLFGSNPLPAIGHVDQAHLTRDGAIGLFVGAVGLVAAIRPRFAVTAVIVSSLGVLAQVVAGAVDEQHTDLNARFEFVHLLTLAVLVMAVVLAADRLRVRGPRRRTGLRLVPGAARQPGGGPPPG